MKTYHHNGEHWYYRNWTVFHHIRHWFIWFGGWEKPNGNGWRVFLKGYDGKVSLIDPTPISLFGHFFTHYGWGWQMRIGKRWLTWSRSGGVLRVYLSWDGTPSGATTWLHGTPPEIENEAEERTPAPKADQ